MSEYKKISFGKRGRPKKIIEPEFPVDPHADTRPYDWEDILGTCCEACLWLKTNEMDLPSCRIFKELTLIGCSACMETLEAYKEMLLEIQEYTLKKKEKDPTDASGDRILEHINKELEHIRKNTMPDYTGWMAGYFADRKRGKKGGGGEQEKAPNKAKMKKPLKNGLSFVEPWSGFDF